MGVHSRKNARPPECGICLASRSSQPPVGTHTSTSPSRQLQLPPRAGGPRRKDALGQPLPGGEAARDSAPGRGCRPRQGQTGFARQLQPSTVNQKATADGSCAARTSRCLGLPRTPPTLLLSALVGLAHVTFETSRKSCLQGAWASRMLNRPLSLPPRTALPTPAAPAPSTSPSHRGRGPPSLAFHRECVCVPAGAAKAFLPKVVQARGGLEQQSHIPHSQRCYFPS